MTESRSKADQLRRLRELQQGGVRKVPKPPRGPRNLKAGGFTNGLWRFEERKKTAKPKGKTRK